MENSLTTNNIGLKDLILQGTYYGGCGYSYMIKKKIIESVKKYLEDNYKHHNLNITFTMKNYKIESNEVEVDINYDKDETSFNEYEFNIFLIFQRKRTLVATSDVQNPIAFFPHMQSSLDQPKEDFLKGITEKIIKIVENPSE